MKKIAVLISDAGTGSNLQAMIDSIAAKKLAIQICVVISDSKEAIGIQRAKNARIPTYIFDSREEGLEILLQKKYPVDFIVLTGWKKIIPDSLITILAGKIINIHPGLIPDTFDGFVLNPDQTSGLWNRGKFTKKALQNFLDQKATYAGSSVHFLSKTFDFGKVLGRCFEKIRSGDTVETLYKRLKVKEHTLLVDILKELSET